MSLNTKPLSLADELSEAIQEHLHLNPISGDVSSSTYLENHQKDFVETENTSINHILKQTEENEYISSDSNSKERYSGGSDSSISTFRESVSPPPLCPIPNPYESYAQEQDHSVRRLSTSQSDSDLTTNRLDETVSPRPWLDQIPKHYSLDYDFSDDWDLVIAGTTAATGTIIKRN